MRGDRLARPLQHSYGDVPRNARKVIEKLIKGLASFKRWILQRKNVIVTHGVFTPLQKG